MPAIDYRVLAVLIGYAIGLIQTAYIIGRLKGIDIRQHGSGGAGATNVNRVLGSKAGIFVFVVDIVKGIAAFTIPAFIWHGGGTFLGYGFALPGLYGAIGCVLGHSFPFYLKFKGGKGMAVTIGLMIAIDIRMFLIAAAVGITLIAITKYISLASLTLGAMMPIVLHFLGYPTEEVLVSLVISVLIWYLHRENIGRLLRGEENKFSFKKKGVL
ncbi:MAG: glycerol-3-phosphate 1-O-acyltransferase PlsY [Defluviitaleaceae bacterium]|nr:glycerol-3-phosphate 1-O-acyltransferase PlsY [Defluviitaleaceae bacterium]